MTDLQISIGQTPDNYDWNHVVWLRNGRAVGSGYQGKSDGRLHVMRCPECSKENYALTVAQGPCAWCGFNPNETVDEQTSTQ